MQQLSESDAKACVRYLGKRRAEELFGLIARMQERFYLDDPKVTRMRPEIMFSRQLYESPTQPQLDIHFRFYIHRPGWTYGRTVGIHCEQRLDHTPVQCKDAFMQLMRLAASGIWDYTSTVNIAVEQ